MNIHSIFKKECIHNIRDIKANVLMILFPIALILILGTAISPMFNSNVELGFVQVLYTDEADEYLSSGYTGLMEQIQDDMGIGFDSTDDVQDGIEQIRKSSYSCYIHLTNNQEIILYKNDRYAFEANLVEAILHTFIEKYNVYMEVATIAPQRLEEISTMSMPRLLNVRSLDRERTVGAMDYYAVTMLTLILLYSANTGIQSIKREERLKTGNRLLVSPIKKYEVLTGKVLGCIIITIMQGLVVFVFSKLVLNAYWGNNPAAVIAIIASEAIMAVSMGIALSYVKSDATMAGLINTIIPILVLLGGGYAPLEVLGGGIQKLSVISPVRWTNQALLRLIYDNDISLIYVAIGINLGLATIFLIVASLVYRREGS